MNRNKYSNLCKEIEYSLLKENIDYDFIIVVIVLVITRYYYYFQNFTTIINRKISNKITSILIILISIL